MNKILKRDFDEAVKQKWDGDKCIIAQHNLRTLGFTDTETRFAIADDFPRAAKAMNVFDRHFRNHGDKNKPELKKLRASLPIPLE